METPASRQGLWTIVATGNPPCEPLITFSAYPRPGSWRLRSLFCPIGAISGGTRRCGLRVHHPGSRSGSFLVVTSPSAARWNDAPGWRRNRTLSPAPLSRPPLSTQGRFLPPRPAMALSDASLQSHLFKDVERRQRRQPGFRCGSRNRPSLCVADRLRHEPSPPPAGSLFCNPVPALG